MAQAPLITETSAFVRWTLKPKPSLAPTKNLTPLVGEQPIPSPHIPVSGTPLAQLSTVPSKPAVASIGVVVSHAGAPPEPPPPGPPPPSPPAPAPPSQRTRAGTTSP